MDSIKEFLKSIEERFSNPFILAYIISWLAWNWEIPITLAFQTNSELIKLGYKSFENFIQIFIYNHPWRFYLLPILSASIFTAGMPWLKAVIYWVQTKADVVKDRWWIDATKESKVPMERYLTMRSQIKAKSDILENIIDTESSSQEKLTKQITLTQAAEAEVLEQRDFINTLKKRLDEQIKNSEALQSEFNKQREQLTSRTTIADLFQNTWYNEYQIIRNDGSIHSGIELFDIKQGVINVEGQAEFYIDEPLILNKERFIYFKKRRIKDSLDVTSVYLVAVQLANTGQRMWIGYEQNTNFNLSYVRYYSKHGMPNHLSGLAFVNDKPTDGQELNNVHRLYGLLRKLITNKDFE